MRGKAMMLIGFIGLCVTVPRVIYLRGKHDADKWYAAHGYVKMPTIIADEREPGYCKATLIDPDTRAEIVWALVPNNPQLTLDEFKPGFIGSAYYREDGTTIYIRGRGSLGSQTYKYKLKTRDDIDIRKWGK